MFGLKEFVGAYDSPHTVVLLEGKREVKPEDIPKLKELGRLLCAQSKQMTFRSGNAKGADEYFIEGVSEVDPSRIKL